MRISDWSSDVCSSDLANDRVQEASQVGLFAQDQTDRTEIGQGASFRETQTEIVDAGFVGGQFKQGIERVDGNLEVGVFPAVAIQADRTDQRVRIEVIGGRQWNVPRQARPDRKSTRLNSSHQCASRMPSSA